MSWIRRIVKAGERLGIRPIAERTVTCEGSGWEAVYFNEERLEFRKLYTSASQYCPFGHFRFPPENCLRVINPDTGREDVFLAGNHLGSALVVEPKDIRGGPRTEIEAFRKLSEDPRYWNRRITVDGTPVPG